ncbi:MAG: iron chelate uptake ABC transporter family permease subunit, partial [Thermoplasmata archaeon]|nr:iron chelate uptake ABC transporter family permease subunit [Thermoplasmata archaeon]
PFVGIVGFVGLIIPHLLRRVVGPDHRILIPGSALLGGTFLILSDLASRALTDMIIPLGIITGLLGGAFFIYLLMVRREA